MSYSNEEWKNDKKLVNRGVWYVLRWVLLFVGVSIVIGAIVWGANVLISGPKGQGDAIVEKNSSENFIAAQAEFERGWQDIKSTDQKIALATVTLAQDPEDKTAQQTLAGLQSYCLSAVAEYNANARSFLSEDFRAADLPAEINTNDPATDCKA